MAPPDRAHHSADTQARVRRMATLRAAQRALEDVVEPADLRLALELGRTLLRRLRGLAGDLGQAEIEKQVRFQQGSGRVDPARAIAFGKQYGAEVVVYGALASIEKTKGRSFESVGAKKEDVYYQFVLNAVNIETGELMWSNEEELRKQQVTGLFGS
jgi:hypothetical protein